MHSLRFSSSYLCTRKDLTSGSSSCLFCFGLYFVIFNAHESTEFIHGCHIGAPFCCIHPHGFQSMPVFIECKSKKNQYSLERSEKSHKDQRPNANLILKLKFYAEPSSNKMASNSSKGKKRSLIDIAASFVVRNGEKAGCNIDPNGSCTYTQAKYDPGNFIRHFRLRHSELANAHGLYKDYVPAVKKPRVIPKRPIAIDQQLLIEAVVKLVTEHRLPLNCFEWDGFQLLLKPICQAVGCTLNRQTIKDHLRVMAQRVKEILKEEMKNKLISLKIDSASRLNRHILGVNVQYALGERVVIRTLGMYVREDTQMT